MREIFDEFVIIQFSEIRFPGQRFRIFRLNPINASACFVPIVARVNMGETRMLPVRKIDSSIGTDLHVDRTEPAVLGFGNIRDINRSIR